MQSLADISQTRRPKGQMIAVSSLFADGQIPSKFLPKKVHSRKALRAFERERKRYTSALGWDYTEDEDKVLVKMAVYQWFYKVPSGATIYQTGNGEIIALDYKLDWVDVEPIILDTERVTIKEYSLVTKVQYLYVLIAVLNQKIKLCLYVLTPPSPQDKSAHFTRTLFHAYAMSEGFFMSIFSRPPPKNADCHQIFNNQF